jgi:hypothetical protein
MRDYKESEKLVCDLYSSFDDLVESIDIALMESGGGEFKYPTNLASLSEEERVFRKNNPYSKVQNLLLALIAIVDGNLEVPFRRILDIIFLSETELYRIFNQELSAKTKRLNKPLVEIRRAIGRIYIIKKSTYIKGCYSLVFLMITIVFTLMTTTKWPRDTASGTAMAFTVIITFLFTFLFLLIVILEDPFRYPKNYNMDCYLRSERSEMDWKQKFLYETSIDMSGLAVEFGKTLQTKLFGEESRRGSELSDPQNREQILRMNALHELANGNKDELLAMERNSDPAAKADVETDRRRPEVERFNAPPLHWCVFALSSLPFVAAMVVLRFAVWYGAGVDGWVKPSAFLSLISLTVFVTALLLQGLVQDYKDAERMPSDLVGAFLGLEAAVKIAEDMRKKKQQPQGPVLQGKGKQGERKELASDGQGRLESDVGSSMLTGRLNTHILRMLLAVISIADTELHGDTPLDTPFYRASEAIREAEKALLTAFIQEETFDAIPCLLKPISTVRQIAARMQVIQKTRYIPAGYTIVDSMTLIVLFLMALSDWPVADQWYSAIGYTTSVTFLFVYLGLLIRAIEDPFSYRGNRNFRCFRDQELHKPSPSSWTEAFTSESVDLRVLTLGVGGRLYRYLPDHLSYVQRPQGQPPEWLRTVTSASQASWLLALDSLLLCQVTASLQCGSNDTGQSDIVVSDRGWLGTKIGGWALSVIDADSPPSGFREEVPVHHLRNPRYLMRRYRLLLSALPLVVVLYCCRLAVWYGGGVGGWVNPEVFTSFIGLVIFVSTVLVQGVVVDYKDSERITSELFSAFQGLTAAVEVSP